MTSRMPETVLFIVIVLQTVFTGTESCFPITGKDGTDMTAKYSINDLILCKNHLETCLDYLCRNYKIENCHSTHIRSRMREEIDRRYEDYLNPGRPWNNRISPYDAYNRRGCSEGCGYGSTCRMRRCVPLIDGRCNDDQSCNYPYFCHDGQCHVMPFFRDNDRTICQNSGSCPGKTICRKGACIPIINGQLCQKRNECAVGYKCAAKTRCKAVQDVRDVHKFKCSTSLECPAEQACRYGQCHMRKSNRYCRSDYDCTGHLYTKCSEGFCKIPPRSSTTQYRRDNNNNNDIFINGRPDTVAADVIHALVIVPNNRG